MNDFVADILMRICKVLGNMPLANLIDFRESVSEKKLYKMMSLFVQKLEEKHKVKLFEFRDRTQYSVMRYYIISLKKSVTLEGEPTLVMNDFPEGLKAKDNPVLNLELIYDDVDVRDEDYERLKFMLK